MAQTFPVYDALLYTGKPDLATYGLQPIRVIYGGELWEKNQDMDEPNLHKVAEVAKALLPGSLVCVDIEHWPLKGSSLVVNKSIQKYLSIAREIRRHQPLVRLGFYGIMPIRDYWRAIKFETSAEHAQWKEQNMSLRPLAEEVDVIFPSLYTFYSDQEGWQRYAEENLKQARIYGKPVLPFIWPRYHDSNRVLKYFDLPAGFWRLQLETLRQHADGIVLWGGWEKNWDKKAAWWRETETFLNLLKGPFK